jgi:hypothetical protein
MESAHRAITRGDRQALDRHGRFPGPISDRLIGRAVSDSARARIKDVVNAALEAYAGQARPCR